MALPIMSPAPTNTVIESTQPHVREDLLAILTQVDPTDTPFFTSLDHGSAAQTLVEWLVQELNPPQNVPQPEGFTAAISPSKTPARLNNVCQIAARTVGVSNTMRVVDSVGEEEYSRQILMRAMELRRDTELTITGASVKTIADPRQLSGIQTWISNSSMGAGAGVAPIGDGTNAGTAGTARNLSIPLVTDAMQLAWDDGGEPSMAIMSGALKRTFTNLSATQPASSNGIVASQILQHTRPAPITVMGAVGVFMTDYGSLNLIADRFMPLHVILMPDPDYVEMAMLPGRSFSETELAVTGDSQSGMVVMEGTLRVLAPKAHAAVRDLIE